MDEENNFRPQIITEAIHLDLDGLNMEKVYELKDAEKTEELYKYLLIVQCNALNKVLPGMFQKIADYTELLLPDNLLREGSVIQQMIELIPEDDWKDAVQIIGWLYQYYNVEKKDDVFAALKKNVKITKENIPAATQLLHTGLDCSLHGGEQSWSSVAGGTPRCERATFADRGRTVCLCCRKP